jgi:NAD(P)-dependent dehydrogenase (short-subunit alcohol dehydrogenase family)
MSKPRTIVVSGAASGIGAATARLLRERGETVIGVDIKEPAAGSVDHFVAMDQSESQSIDAAVDKLPEGIDGLVNSAGVPPSPTFPPATVLKVNFYGLREFTGKLLGKISHGGAIVNLSSGAGMGWPQNIPLLRKALAVDDIHSVDDFVTRHEIHNDGIDNQAAYPLSKQLLIVWTATAYPIWKETGVRMNAIAPGAVTTPILDDFLTAFGEESARRMQAIGAASAEDIARIAILLLDPAYEWINGMTVPAERGAITYGGISKMGLV